MAETLSITCQAYSLANVALARLGAKHRKRSGAQQASEQEDAGIGLAIAVGALLDGIPESIVIGVGLLPEASEGTHELTGLLTVLGFLLAFVLTKLA